MSSQTPERRQSTRLQQRRAAVEAPAAAAEGGAAAAPPATALDWARFAALQHGGLAVCIVGVLLLAFGYDAGWMHTTHLSLLSLALCLLGLALHETRPVKVGRGGEHLCRASRAQSLVKHTAPRRSACQANSRTCVGAQPTLTAHKHQQRALFPRFTSPLLHPAPSVRSCSWKLAPRPPQRANEGMRLGVARFGC